MAASLLGLGWSFAEIIQKADQKSKQGGGMLRPAKGLAM
jgi:hypothetical protein